MALKDFSLECCWGLYSNNWTGGITLDDNPDYNVFDVPTLTNRTEGSTTISIGNYRDEVAGDAEGFKIQQKGTALAELGWTESDIDYKDTHKGDILPWGLINTLKIIQHRDKILDGVTPMLKHPTSLKDLEELISTIIADNGSQSKYQQFYFPSASLCHEYEPEIKPGEKIADSLKKGHWFLPSLGELARIYWYFKHDNEQREITNGIFEKSITASIFATLKTLYETSTEASVSSAYIINTTNGTCNNATAKSSNYSTRAIAAF